MAMKDEELLRYVLLSIMPGFGTVSQTRLLKLCGGINECFEIDAEKLFSLERTNDKGKNNGSGKIGMHRLELFLVNRDSESLLDRAAGIIEECNEKNINIIALSDMRYPLRFSGMDDMPLVLFAQGDFKINHFERSIGIVGARRCSMEGKQAAISLVENKGRDGMAIISGMAKGIDSYAHTAALKNNGYTIAVLGNGPDICYPKEHEKLYEEIISHGCILSEYPPKTEPREYLFPKRNRLIAALSDEIYVIDTGRHSGTETTVQAAGEYGRRVIKVM